MAKSNAIMVTMSTSMATLTRVSGKMIKKMVMESS